MVSLRAPSPMLVAQKKALRKQVTALLKLVPPASLTSQSQAVTNHLLALPSFLAARSISIYLSTPTSEIQTDLIIRRAFEMGKHLYVPFCPVGERELMMMLRLESVDHFEGLGLNRWGIRDLDPTTVGMLEDVDDLGSGGLDLILVPGLAFDKTGSRLGHGRGYYDRYLLATADYPSRFSKAPPLTVALALREQVIEGTVPTDSNWDQKPSHIITPEGLLSPQIL